MEIPPTTRHPKARGLEQILPARKRFHLLPEPCLFRAAKKTEPTGEEVSIGDEKQKSCPGASDTHHLSDHSLGVNKMLQRPEARDQIKLAIFEWEILRKGAQKVSLRKRFAADLKRHPGDINPSDSSPALAGRREPLSQAAAEIEEPLSVPGPKSRSQATKVPRHASRDARPPMVDMVVETTDTIVVSHDRRRSARPGFCSAGSEIDRPDSAWVPFVCEPGGVSR